MDNEDCTLTRPHSQVDCEEWPSRGRCRWAIVDCDDDCGALVNPTTVEELRAALNHWQHHSYLHGCSHAN